MSHTPDCKVGAEGIRGGCMPKLSVETRPRLLVDSAKLTPHSTTKSHRTSRGEHTSASSTNRWDWCVAALSLAYICVHKDLVLGAINEASATPTPGWIFAVAFHVAFGVCCTLLIGWGMHKGPGSAWYKSWRDEYLFVYTLVFTTNVFIVANQWPTDERFKNREVYQPTWDPVFSSMVMLLFHIPPRFLVLQGLEAAIVHSYVAIGMHGLHKGDPVGACVQVLINVAVCAVGPAVMSAAWLCKAKQERPHRSAPRNALQHCLQSAEQFLMKHEARMLRFMATVDRAVLAVVFCGPIVGIVAVKNFKAISAPVVNPPSVCASSPFEVLAAMMCTAVLILAEVGLKAMNLVKQLQAKEEVVRDIFPSYIVDRLNAAQARSPRSSRSTRGSDAGDAGDRQLRPSGTAPNSSHGSSSDGWVTPNSGRGSLSSVSSLTGNLTASLSASISGGFGYFSRWSDSDRATCPLTPSLGSGAVNASLGASLGVSPGDGSDQPMTPPTPLLHGVGLRAMGMKAGCSATSTPTHGCRKSVGSIAQRHAAVTILFADICGFTEMSDSLDPLAVMDMLHSLYSAYDSLSEVLPGVYKIETIGDCYMAASGLIHEHPDHAEHMLQFALYMQELAAKHQRPDGSPITIRIGLHSGAVTSGLIGSVRRRYCLFGDTVNTASRMETTCTPGGIQLSASTHALVAHITEIPWREKKVEVKGKGLMTVYEWLPTRTATELPPPPPLLQQQEQQQDGQQPQLLGEELQLLEEAQGWQHDAPQYAQQEQGGGEQQPLSYYQECQQLLGMQEQQQEGQQPPEQEGKMHKLDA